MLRPSFHISVRKMKDFRYIATVEAYNLGGESIRFESFNFVEGRGWQLGYTGGGPVVTGDGVPCHYHHPPVTITTLLPSPPPVTTIPHPWHHRQCHHHHSPPLSSPPFPTTSHHHSPPQSPPFPTTSHHHSPQTSPLLPQPYSKIT